MSTIYPDGSIPLNDAVDLTANWREYLATSDDGFVTQSFLIPIASFNNIVLYNPEAEAVRAYIGLEDPTDPTTAKLVLVPVVEGQDVPILTLPGGDGSIQVNVFDMSTACPPDCPSTGSLLSE